MIRLNNCYKTIKFIKERAYMIIMLRLNKDYIKIVEEDLTPKDEPGHDIYFKIASSLEGFVLNGSAKDGLSDIKYHDKDSHIIVAGFRNIFDKNVEERLAEDGYNLGFKGLVVPQERFTQLDGLDLNLDKVYKTHLEATEVKKGNSFLVITKFTPWSNPREDYVISPLNPQIYNALEALGAPSDLIVNK